MTTSKQPVALVTGVSRAVSIGDAVVRRLRADGATVVATGWPPHDEAQVWGPGVESGEEPRRHDLADPSVPGALVDEVYEEHGGLDVVVAAHAESRHVGLDALTADELDRCWAVNVRSIVLLAQRWAERRRGSGISVSAGRLVFFTSGQHLAPMADEIPYALSKGALHQLVRTLDHALGEVGVIANCINPGPVDTGWADSSLHADVASMFPDGQWTSPDQTAELIAFLVSDGGSLLRGQVVDAENGFDRFA